MRVFGICGGSGSGKSTVSLILSRFGAYVLDADRIYHELVDAPSPCVSALADAFGTQILLSDGSLDRRALSRIVFFGEDAAHRLRRLNEIAHAFVKDEIRRRIGALDDTEGRFVIIDAPLLFESGLDRDCDAVIGVVADDDVRIERMTRRDAISVEEAKGRMKSQLSNTELYRLCDFCIENNGDVETLTERVAGLYEQLKQVYFMN